ncbi:MAG: hypothetical protein JNM00_16735, partial [Flavobacteriales bacterium]|nr:hypothetical protein [Flavobacteriales bacterium]
VQNTCGTYELSYTGIQSFNECPGNYTLTRTWSAMNTCGQFAVFIQIVTFEDTNPPAIVYAPVDATYYCALPGGAGLYDFPIFEDNCSNNLIYDYEWTVINSENPCQSIRVISYTAMDECGNFSLVTWNEYFNDETPPVLVYGPQNQIVNCEYQENTLPDDLPLFDEECGPYTPEYTSQILNQQGCTTEVLWEVYAFDDCGNYTYYSWIVTYQDVTAPVFDLVPPTCLDCTVGDIAQYPQFHDDCETGAVVIGYTWVPVDVNQTNLVWTLTDACGNVSSATTLYTHPCSEHSVEVEIINQYPDANLDIEYNIYNNVTTQVASGTFVIDAGHLLDFVCLPDGCYSIYISPQGVLQDLLWSISVDGTVVFTSDAYEEYIYFSVGEGECNAGGCANEQACDFTPFGTSFQNCCYYSCVNGAVTAGTSPETNTWTIYTDEGLSNAIYSGIAPHSAFMCLLEDPFTTYYLVMMDSLCNGWSGSHFQIDIPEWNWSFDTTLVSGCEAIVPFTTGGPGCMEVGHCNYNPLATIDDGSCAATMQANMVMYDSGNNGWANWWYTIIDSQGDSLITGTLPSGAYGVDEICLAPGCYDLLLHKPFNGAGLGGQVTWSLQYPDGTVIIAGGAPSLTTFGFHLAGNLNGDCVVNVADLLAFNSQFPCNGSCGNADLNIDGVINITDLLLFTGYYGTSY